MALQVAIKETADEENCLLEINLKPFNLALRLVGVYLNIPADISIAEWLVAGS